MGITCEQIVQVFLQKGIVFEKISNSNIKTKDGGLTRQLQFAADRFIAQQIAQGNVMQIQKAVDKADRNTVRITNPCCR